MEFTDFIKNFAGQGVFCLLFVYLLLETRKENKIREDKYIDREDKYQATIEKNHDIIKDLSSKFDIIAEVKKDVEIIKNTFQHTKN